MAEHTPGPWFAEKYDDDPSWMVHNDFETFIRVRTGLGMTPAMVAANARLCAAAPDYFAGVEQMLLNEECGGDGWWKGWEMLKAAHAKTEGK